MFAEHCWALLSARCPSQCFPHVPWHLNVLTVPSEMSAVNIPIFPKGGLRISNKLYSFPIAMTTSYYSLSSLKPLKFILLQFWRPGSQNKFYLVKAKILAELVLSGGSWGACVSWPFPASRGCLCSLACDPISIFKAKGIVSSNLFLNLTPSLSYT